MFVLDDRQDPARAAAPAPGPRRRITRRAVARFLAPYLYLAPALLLLVVWTYQPLGQAVQLSTVSWNLLPTSPMTPVGADNYTRLLDLPAFWGSLGRTATLILGLLPFTVVLPVLIALASRRVHGRARTVYQALVFAPFLIAPVAAAAVWRWLLHPGSGFVDQLIGTGHNWVYDAGTAQAVIVLITAWQLLGFAVLVVWAGLAGISGDYREAAQVDGATPGQIRRWITLPLLSPTVMFLVLTTVLLSPTLSFPLIDSMTQGGPAQATTNIYYLLWDYAFHTFDAGLSAAAGVLLFVGFGLLAALLVWISEKVAVHDD
ncbi:carbohydrate ABC transporter permease [Nocardia caishijiensis]|uniref:Carbohydrate ABC transporter membrane protein 1 (CUT1 family) n=1 Tax=Nocardia caishijiensis TaxID=184756 RepID=A0ABQ6YHN7_9NOCA|nr:sugar ABC transporter permease [Nocardia caishijiensis]KAF0845305.1 carbohydrate ABC transporter membrane protein 1 (CUT1 family) [Nocardia caishijiensis]